MLSAWLLVICLAGLSLFFATGQQIDFIRNGTDAPAGKYPYFVGIHIRSYGLICGGTLIHPSGIVLTAAHCRNFGYGRMPLFMFTVELDGVHYPVHSANTHPSFQAKHPEDGFDIMLFYFHNPNSNAAVVRLNADGGLPGFGDLCSVAGYGLTRPQWKARPLRLQEVTDLKIEDCAAAPEWWFHKTPDLICTGPGPSQANVCTFDSGSPLLLQLDHDGGSARNINDRSNDEQYEQIGIVSLSDNDEGEPLCSNEFAAFTPVALYYGWIQENLPTTNVLELS